MSRILILTSRFPYPLNKGDKLRIYHQIRQLSNPHEVHVVALHTKPIPPADREEVEKICKTLTLFKISLFQQVWGLLTALFTGLPFQVGIYYSAGSQRHIRKLIGRINPEKVYCHLIRMSEYVPTSGEYTKVLDYMDAFSKGMERRAAHSKFPIRQLCQVENKRLLAYESHIFDKFDERVIISSQDRDLIPHPQRNTINVIPNGVCLEDYFPLDRKKSFDLVFVGNMGYPPNIVAAEYVATQVIPLILKKRPHTRFLIAGIGAPARLHKLANQHIQVIEHFPHIREAYGMSRVLIAPMLINIGLQNKLLQAMAMRVPCITSPLANRALQAPEGSCIRVCTTPEAYASTAMELLDHPAKAQEMADRAYAFVKNGFSWEIMNQKLEQVMDLAHE